jgi:LmbE family N-acetylglucosaminyl deacetylase
MARILAIHAHPDDVEILAGGSLALLAGRGHEITIASLTPGDCGSRELGPEAIAAVRRREAAQAAELIGARYLCVEMRDLAIFNDDPARRRITRVLRETRPQLVLTASPSDYHCDHEAASALVRDACFAAPAPNYHTPGEPAAPVLESIPHLYFMDPLGGRDRENNLVVPDFVVNVAETFERKREMLASHASQRAWLKQHHGMDDYLQEMELRTRERGQLVGLSHGEGFRLYRGHAYPQSPLLEELLGGSAVPYGRQSYVA